MIVISLMATREYPSTCCILLFIIHTCVSVFQKPIVRTLFFESETIYGLGFEVTIKLLCDVKYVINIWKVFFYLS